MYAIRSYYAIIITGAFAIACMIPLWMAFCASFTNENTLIRDGYSLLIRRPAVWSRPCVITSYSIHYTKLYDLLRNQGRILTRAQITDHVWNNEFEYDSNIVDVYIRYLRGKIDKDFDVKLIHTIRGFGYVMRCEQWKK